MPREAEVRADLRSTRCLAHAKGQAAVPSRSICRLLNAEDGLAGAARMVSVSRPWAAAARGSTQRAAVWAARSSALAGLSGASAGTPLPRTARAIRGAAEGAVVPSPG